MEKFVTVGRKHECKRRIRRIGLHRAWCGDLCRLFGYPVGLLMGRLELDRIADFALCGGAVCMTPEEARRKLIEELLPDIGEDEREGKHDIVYSQKK